MRAHPIPKRIDGIYNPKLVQMGFAKVTFKANSKGEFNPPVQLEAGKPVSLVIPPLKTHGWWFNALQALKRKLNWEYRKRAWKHYWGLCRKTRGGYECGGSNDYKECGE